MIAAGETEARVFKWLALSHAGSAWRSEGLSWAPAPKPWLCSLGDAWRPCQQPQRPQATNVAYTYSRPGKYLHDYKNLQEEGHPGEGGGQTDPGGARGTAPRDLSPQADLLRPGPATWAGARSQGAGVSSRCSRQAEQGGGALPALKVTGNVEQSR